MSKPSPETNAFALGAFYVFAGAACVAWDCMAVVGVVTLLVGGAMVLMGADMAAFQWFRKHYDEVDPGDRLHYNCDGT